MEFKFWFSWYEMKHNIAHILIGAAVSNLIYLLYQDIFLSLLFVISISIAIEMEQLRQHDWLFWEYAPADQLRDILTYIIGALTVLLWLI